MKKIKRIVMVKVINKILDSKLDIHAFDICTKTEIKDVLYEFSPDVNTQEVLFVFTKEQAEKVSVEEWRNIPNVMLSYDCIKYVDYISPKNLLFFRKEDFEKLKEALK